VCHRRCSAGAMAVDTMHRTLGLDIGGANLKAAGAPGRSASIAFPVWREPRGLADALARLLDRFPESTRIAATMTAELCDCFPTKRAGVLAVLSALTDAASRDARRQSVHVWLTSNRFATPDQARCEPMLAAASNWSATARLAARWCSGRTGVLIDIGSTTTDLIPLVDGAAATVGFDDTSRLAAGELVYTGVGRTPVCAVVHRLPGKGAQVRVAAELFATTLDAHLLLGSIPEDPLDHGTADGRPATIAFARARLARMVCADVETMRDDDMLAIARAIADAQRSDIEAALATVIERLPQPPTTVIVCGAGEFLARQVAPPGATVVAMSDRLGAELSKVAPAYAVAVLLDESEGAL